MQCGLGGGVVLMEDITTHECLCLCGDGKMRTIFDMYCMYYTTLSLHQRQILANVTNGDPGYQKKQRWNKIS